MPSECSFTPTTIHGLHVLSFFLSILILVVSIQDCGVLSLCLNPFFAILTIAFHITMLVVVYKNPEDAQMPSIWFTMAAYLLTLGWLGAYVSMAIVLSSRETSVALFDTHIMIPQNMRDYQKFQILLDAAECVVVGTIAVKSTVTRSQMCRVKEMNFFD
ncbi:hypothetical protein BDN70DRAFT_997900 [Pholiota conissans]|uniref:Uncharacterized protein n=1 Tax=Pholiota conissans TaxID=109636 RepID=A0A9P5YSM6_9AGAR|nr:hypothetical protein BDN70DRAFT_997900 [Pholiota conissans]